jgi:NitT/TauT family transport system substrate-binding protein
VLVIAVTATRRFLLGRNGNLMHALACLALCLFSAGVAHSDDENLVRVGVLQFGTVNWELDVIQTHGLAAREGVDLQVIPLASKSATNVAVQGGAADIIVSDWIWVSRQRAAGRKYTFVPYSLAVGALMTRPDAGVDSLTDLKGKRLGVAGGPVDKSWLLLRAYTRRELGIDVAELAEPNFAAPPLLNELMLRGELPAVLNFWHYGARLKAAGMQTLVGIKEILPALGVEEPIPLLGWVFHEEWAESNGEALLGFLRASYEAKRILMDSNAEWERIRPLLRVADDVTLNALRDAYRDGIPSSFGAAEVKAAGRVFAILAEEGGEELVGPQPSLSPGTFWNGFTIDR